MADSEPERFRTLWKLARKFEKDEKARAASPASLRPRVEGAAHADEPGTVSASLGVPTEMPAGPVNPAHADAARLMEGAERWYALAARQLGLVRALEELASGQRALVRAGLLLRDDDLANHAEPVEERFTQLTRELQSLTGLMLDKGRRMLSQARPDPGVAPKHVNGPDDAPPAGPEAQEG